MWLSTCTSGQQKDTKNRSESTSSHLTDTSKPLITNEKKMYIMPIYCILTLFFGMLAEKQIYHIRLNKSRMRKGSAKKGNF